MNKKMKSDSCPFLQKDIRPPCDPIRTSDLENHPDTKFKAWCKRLPMSALLLKTRGGEGAWFLLFSYVYPELKRQLNIFVFQLARSSIAPA